MESEPEDGATRPTHVTETLVAAGGIVPDAFLAPPTARMGWSADLAVTELYSMHYRALVRLAALLVRDTPTAEEVVQDAFVAMHGGWQRLRDAEKALAYLRQAVVNRSRSVLRHRTVVDKNLQKAPPDMPSAEHGAMVLLERHAVVAALRDLPERQREAIVLRYYADLSEAEIAATMGISRGAVKSHTARGMTRPPRGLGAGIMTRSGHDGTPPPGHDFGDFLRHALHAAADQVRAAPGRAGADPRTGWVRTGVRQQAFRSDRRRGIGRFPGPPRTALEPQARRSRRRTVRRRTGRGALTRSISRGTGGTDCSGRPWQGPASCSPSASPWRWPRCARPWSSSARRWGLRPPPPTAAAQPRA